MEVIVGYYRGGTTLVYRMLCDEYSLYEPDHPELPILMLDRRRLLFVDPNQPDNFVPFYNYYIHYDILRGLFTRDYFMCSYEDAYNLLCKLEDLGFHLVKVNSWFLIADRLQENFKVIAIFRDIDEVVNSHLIAYNKYKMEDVYHNLKVHKKLYDMRIIDKMYDNIVDRVRVNATICYKYLSNVKNKIHFRDIIDGKYPELNKNNIRIYKGSFL